MTRRHVDPRAALQRAVDLRREGFYDEAERELRRLTKLDRKNAQAPLVLGELLAEQGRDDEALPAFRRSVSLRADHAPAHLALAAALRRRGDRKGALASYRRAAQLEPTRVEAHEGVGSMCFDLGDASGAVDAYARAAELEPRSAHRHYALGSALLGDGRPDAACASLARALELEPRHADARVCLGAARIALGDRGGARDAFEGALDMAPRHALAHYDLAAVLFEAGRPEPAIAALERALECDARYDPARFFLGVLLDESGRAHEADEHFAAMRKKPGAEHSWIEAWRYVQSERTASTRHMMFPAELLQFAFESARPDGLVLEFGVRFGTSIRQIAQWTSGTVHGFDGFAGLPESWLGMSQGAYSTRGALPATPPSVRLHVGLFEETLPLFLAEHDGPVRFLHVDSDLYSSACTVLEGLAPRMERGAVVLFDDYFMNQSWKEDEHRAFREAVQRHGWSPEFLGFCLFGGQAAFRLS